MAGEVKIRSAARPLQKAIYSRLKTALSGTATVHDHVPQATSYPYVVVGDDTEKSWKTKGRGGIEATVTVHSYSRFLGREEVKSIMDTVSQQMTQTSIDLSADNFSALPLELELSEVLSEFSPQGTTFHGVQRFRTLIEDTT